MLSHAFWKGALGGDPNILARRLTVRGIDYTVTGVMPPRFSGHSASISLLALAVGAVGLYAAFAHAVSLRRREMAIRIAIGARPGRVIGLVLREAVLLAAVGIAGGWAAALIGGWWIESLLYGTSAQDPVVLASSAVLMLTVAVVATLAPARAASRANPGSLLRTE